MRKIVYQVLFESQIHVVEAEGPVSAIIALGERIPELKDINRLTMTTQGNKIIVRRREMLGWHMYGSSLIGNESINYKGYEPADRRDESEAYGIIAELVLENALLDRLILEHAAAIDKALDTGDKVAFEQHSLEYTKLVKQRGERNAVEQ